MAIMRKFRMARRRHLKNSAAEKYSRVKSLAAVDYHHPLLSLGISSRTSLVFRKSRASPAALGKTGEPIRSPLRFGWARASPYARDPLTLDGEGRCTSSPPGRA